VAQAIADGLVHAAHDVSDGGMLVAVAEMCFAGGLGFKATAAYSNREWFSESPSRYVLEIAPDDLAALQKTLAGVPHTIVGRLDASPTLIVPDTLEVAVSELLATWTKPLAW
jgi:phosphoribosylformylglycinamidine synthase